MKKRGCFLISTALVVLNIAVLSGCSKASTLTDTDDVSAYNVNTVKIAAEVGTITEANVKEICPNAEYVYINDATSGFLAVSSGQADAYAANKATFESALKSGMKGLKAIGGTIGAPSYAAVGISPKSEMNNPEALVNDFINEMQKQGVLDEMNERWVINGDYNMPAIEIPSSPDKAIRIATTGLAEPYSFYKGTELTGYDIELIKRFALYSNAEIEISTYDWAGIVPACSRGKADYIFSNLMETPERRESIGFSVPYRSMYTVLVVKDTQSALQSQIMPEFKTVNDLDGKKIGIVTGSIFDKLTNEYINDAQTSYYNSNPDLVQALKKDKIDGFLCDLPVAQMISSADKSVTYIPDAIMPDKYGYIFQKNADGEKLSKQMNEFLEQINSDGTREKMDGIWFDGNGEKTVTAPETLEAVNGTLRYATSTTMEPFAYVSNNKIVGFDIDLITRFCKQYGYGLECDCMDVSAIIGVIQSEKYDFAGCGISITPERAESVIFSNSYYDGGIVVVVRAVERQRSGENTSLFTSLAESFNKTFVREQRWKLVLSGLVVTLVIAVGSAVLGTLFGFVVCLMRRSGKKVLSGIMAAVIRIIQSIPMVVLLMVLYYLVFAESDIDGIIVAVIAFSLNFGINVSEIMRSGIDTVNAGQWEAANALGLGKTTTFLKVVAPQAVRHSLPAYMGEFINMLKMTSVVGYIAIQDLTKASDIIRSRIYEAFFPLIAITIIYFLLAWGLTSLIGLVEIRIDPKRRHNTLKDINTEFHPNVREKSEIVQHTTEEVIRLEHIKKVYPNVAPLKDINAVISRGDVVTIIGPSGTGKSTLLRMINRLETPTDGNVFVLGENIGEKKSNIGLIRRRVGMVFQNFNLFPHLTVVENIMLAPVALKVSTKQQAYNTAMSLLETVGLSEKALSYPDELSGGQKQRVAIARTLAMQPEIILFDEPTSALDPTMVGEVLTVIRNLAKMGLTMVIVTHEMSFARDVSTRILYVDEGVIYEEGTPERIFDSPQNEKTRQFVRRLKVYNFDITTQKFDFIGLFSGMENFCHKHTLPLRLINNLRTVTEELCIQTILPSLGASPKMTICVEYSDSASNVVLSVTCDGEKTDCLRNADPISVSLINHSAKKYEYSFNTVNRYVVEIKGE